jgi:glycogen synthase
MNVLFASSEAYPFFTSGKLGAMIGSLAVALRRLGTDVRLILPLYGDMQQEWQALARWALLCDYGWDKPSRRYRAMYQKALSL